MAENITTSFWRPLLNFFFLVKIRPDSNFTFTLISSPFLITLNLIQPSLHPSSKTSPQIPRHKSAEIGHFRPTSSEQNLILWNFAELVGLFSHPISCLMSIYFFIPFFILNLTWIKLDTGNLRVRSNLAPPICQVTYYRPWTWSYFMAWRHSMSQHGLKYFFFEPFIID